MAIKHLTDSEIQDFLDGNDLNKENLNHLNGCPHCQGLVNRYKALYGGLRMDRVPELSSNFAAGVMARINAEEEQATNFPWVFLIPVGSLIAGLISIIIFVDPEIFSRLFSLAGIESYLNRILFSKISALCEALNMDVSLAFFVAVALLVAAGLDFIIRRIRRKMISFIF